MFEAIKNWFQSAEGPSAERKWDANAVTMQQPNSPSAPEMSNTITEQPVCAPWPRADSIPPRGISVADHYYRERLNLWMFICGVEVRVRVSAAECEYNFSNPSLMQNNLGHWC